MTLDIEGIKVSQTDLNELARQWHLVVSNIEYASSAMAMRLLSALIMAYLRGRGLRMGNQEGLVKHMGKVSALIQVVSEDATRRFDDMVRFSDTVGVYLGSVPRGR